MATVHGHQPVTEPSFWFTNDGTTPGGRGVPFEHAELELLKILWSKRPRLEFNDPAGIATKNPFRYLAWDNDPFDRRPDWRALPDLPKPKMPSREHWGGAMVAFGGAILVPGPFDALAAGAGIAVFKHPFGAVAGVGAYNAMGMGFVIGGTYLMTS